MGILRSQRKYRNFPTQKDYLKMCKSGSQEFSLGIYFVCRKYFKTVSVSFQILNYFNFP